VRALAIGIVIQTGLAAGAIRAAASAEPRSALDWCAPVVVNPLRRWSDSNTCSQPYGLEEIAAGADVVLFEGAELAEGDQAAAEPGADPCGVDPTLASHARYLRELRARASVRGRSPLAVLQTRFDLVGPKLAARPGFEAGFLLRTGRPWPEVVRFFAEDRSPDCAPDGCRLVDPDPSSPNGDPHRLAPLLAHIEATGGPSASRGVVYYLERSTAGKREYRVTNALADLGNPAYRAWRVAEARRVTELGDYDAVMLNQKLHQYRRFPRSGSGHWIASPAALDVTALNRLADTLWTAPPRGYGYADYVAGWRALAADLRRGGVPYAVTLSLAPWRGERYDDPSTPADESAWIREVARGARLVLLDAPVARRGRDFAAAQAELEAAGARVVPVDSSCSRPGARLGRAAPGRASHREERPRS
jgi:hypothetical protein